MFNEHRFLGGTFIRRVHCQRGERVTGADADNDADVVVLLKNPGGFPDDFRVKCRGVSLGLAHRSGRPRPAHD